MKRVHFTALVSVSSIIINLTSVSALAQQTDGALIYDAPSTNAPRNGVRHYESSSTQEVQFQRESSQVNNGSAPAAAPAAADPRPYIRHVLGGGLSLGTGQQGLGAGLAYEYSAPHGNIGIGVNGVGSTATTVNLQGTFRAPLNCRDENGQRRTACWGLGGTMQTFGQTESSTHAAATLSIGAHINAGENTEFHIGAAAGTVISAIAQDAVAVEPGYGVAASMRTAAGPFRLDASAGYLRTSAQDGSPAGNILYAGVGTAVDLSSHLALFGRTQLLNDSRVRDDSRILGESAGDSSIRFTALAGLAWTTDPVDSSTEQRKPNAGAL